MPERHCRPFVAVYCGSSLGIRDSYSAAAREVATYCSRAGLGVIFGGSAVGLMGELAHAATSNGCEIVGVTSRALFDLEQPAEGLTNLLIVETLHERKRVMNDRAAAFVVLPGGVGSLDEAFEALTWKQIGLHSKPVLFVNIDGYWEPLRRLIVHMRKQGFVSESGAGNIEFVNSVAAAMKSVEVGICGRHLDATALSPTVIGGK